MNFIDLKCQVCGYPRLEKKDSYYKCEACGATKILEESNEQDIEYNDAIKYLIDTPPRFEEAESRFDLIIKKYPNWSSGYWGRLLAKYGIKYEYDKGKSTPSCYIESYDDIRESDDYKKALKYAPDNLRMKYQAEAEKIANVSKIWREKASRINTDIFISFKGTDDETNNDTIDRINMRELYWYLTNKGYKVFFSDVTLNANGIYGENCEPFIFDAILKAKVMIVYGTKPEYFTSTWVQNEWRRYNLAIANEKKKEGSLIVCYEGFDARELPIALKKIQAINADTKHFYSDIEDVIKKFLNSNKEEKIESKEESTDNKKNSINEKTCPNCYEINDINYKFCKKCGYDFLNNRKQNDFNNKKNIKDEILTKINHEKEKIKTKYEKYQKDNKSYNESNSSFENKSYSNERTNNTYINKQTKKNPEFEKLRKYYRGRSPWLIFILCLFFGVFGIHHFARGDIKRGFLFLFTFGLFVYGWIISLFIHFAKAIEYYELRRNLKQ